MQAGGDEHGFPYLETHNELNWVGGSVGHTTDDLLKISRALKDDMILTIPKKRYPEGALETYDILERKGSSPPKLNKADSPSDEKALDDDSRAMLRLAGLILLCLSGERSGVTITVRLQCSRSRSPDRRASGN